MTSHSASQGSVMSYSEDSVRDLVRQVLLRTLGPDGIVEAEPAADPGKEQGTRRPTVTEAAVLAMPKGSQMPVSSGALVTPLARDAARDRGVTFRQDPGPTTSDRGATTQSSTQSQSGASSRPAAGQRTVAIGADHGGYATKEDLRSYLGGLGYEIIDCGTHSTDSVDYPDLAYAVAQLVSDGRAWRGIIVDGAGIGSCVAANKVPGVRAAMCYDHATAINCYWGAAWSAKSSRSGWRPTLRAVAMRAASTRSWLSSDASWAAMLAQRGRRETGLRNR